MRIQVLSLPSQKAGEFESWPFALVFDQCEPRLVDAAWPQGEEFFGFATKCGAVGSLVTSDTVEVL